MAQSKAKELSSSIPQTVIANAARIDDILTYAVALYGSERAATKELEIRRNWFRQIMSEGQTHIDRLNTMLNKLGYTLAAVETRPHQNPAEFLHDKVRIGYDPKIVPLRSRRSL